MTWQTVIILEGEDEAALKARFVELSAKYNTRSPLDIAVEVFRGLPDGFSRATQAGAVWGNSLEIQEEIDKRILSGGATENIVTKDEITLELLALARSPTKEAKDRIAAYKLASEVMGFVGKLGNFEPTGDSSDLLAAIAEKLPA